VASKNDRRINQVFLTEQGRKLEEETMNVANNTLNEALESVPADKIEICKEVLQIVYDNLK
jgi:DNA-binding MarR family transcriptional regulator